MACPQASWHISGEPNIAKEPMREQPQGKAHWVHLACPAGEQNIFGENSPKIVGICVLRMPKRAFALGKIEQQEHGLSSQEKQLKHGQSVWHWLRSTPGE